MKNVIKVNINDKLLISVRIEKLQDAYSTINEHRAEFPNKLFCLFTKPFKSNIGKINH